MCQNKANILSRLSPQEAHGWHDDPPGLGAAVSGLLALGSQGPKVAPEGSPGGSLRRRLWQLNDHAHCPVIGVCLPMQVVRKLVARALGEQGRKLDDYDSHCLAVTESKRRTPLAELIHKELDQRFMLAVREAAKLKSEHDLLAWWRAGVEGPHLAQTFWVTLTHPCCTPAVEYKVLGHVHMLQHQVGMACRADQARFEALMQENAALARHAAQAQERCTRMAAEHATRVAQLEGALMRARADVLAKETRAAQLSEQLTQLQSQVADLDDRVTLVRKLRERVTENQALRRQLRQTQDELLRKSRQVESQQDAESRPELRGDVGAEVAGTPPSPILRDRAVLCVGGRPAIVPIYRELVEVEGGRFLHHDGGEEDSAGQLDATLAAADLVICQTGCVSHNAYWRVKDHCKRTGKRCIFLSTPSRSALTRALGQVAQEACGIK